MSIYKTLFGLLYHDFQTKCGCLNYICNNYKKSNCESKKRKYEEMFYLGDDFLGKFNYQFLNKYKIESNINIFHKNLHIKYKEHLTTFGNPKYKLYLNNQPIIFSDIHPELIYLLKKKEIILPKN